MTTTIRKWFAALDPAPPKALGEQLDTMLAEYRDMPSDQLPEVCMEVAERTLQELLEAGSSSRGSALTLLTVDALVTYAFEAAASDPSRIEQRAATAMARVGALGEPHISGGSA